MSESADRGDDPNIGDPYGDPDRQIKGPTLTLPPERRQELVDKLEEYKERLRTKYASRAPNDRSVVTTVLRIMILERLLRYGNVDSDHLHAECSRTYDYYNSDLFAVAWTVIERYCKSGVLRVKAADRMVEPDETIITLPPHMRDVMRAKMDEYKRRLLNDYKDRPPEDPSVVQVNLRVFIIERLLAEGSVSTWELSREFAHTVSNYHPYYMEQACKIVDRYCQTGGEGLVGGTGLRQ